MIIAGIEFPDADFYDCSEDAEEYTYEHPEPAIVEQRILPERRYNENPRLTIKRLPPITVYARKRRTVEETFFTDQAKKCLDLVIENYQDEYGHDSCLHLGSSASQDVATALQDAFEAADIKPYYTEPADEVVLTPDQVETIMREFCPEWWEEET